ncbi:geranylgeranyl reductase family [Chitinophaga costaii]|uniref:Geranylgeranyl reductase family n=1 Tax=Chitinophaga costaii TaxID=1335309 RepID=A0A1C4AC22_9BACT|nr:NAD(P)/FAD-dependent oxidoreductase [Chitinophaga costaii]PUZ26545.1 NAD(P)/FAD-dependent oxidoreductase [Chitinophaga costaii]SCB92087.1 geranylgeranyl reductase family [Chitinophaga costaii]
MIETKVCIVGAGPAGAAAALQLQQYNIPCVVVDKAVFPRDKVCGDGLSGKVLAALKKIDPGIAVRLQAFQAKQDSWGVTFVAPNRGTMDISYKPAYDKKVEPVAAGFVCKRVDFDNFLVEEVKRCKDVQLFEGQAIDHYTLGKDGYLLSDQEGTFQVKAQMVIVANGAHSSFTKEVAKIQMEPKHYMAGIRSYYQGVTGMHEDGFIELHFLQDLLPGYFWIFPLPNGEANVGIGVLSDVVRKKKLNLKKILLETLEKDPILSKRFENAELLGTIDGYGLPLGSKQRQLSGDRYLLAGDAGYLIDPFTGEGIGNALYSGRIAAEQVKAAIGANDFSAHQLKAYDAEIYRILGPELQLSTRLQRLVQIPWLFNFLLKLGMRNKQLRELMSCMFYELDLRKRLTRPSFYFKLLFNR